MLNDLLEKKTLEEKIDKHYSKIFQQWIEILRTGWKEKKPIDPSKDH